MPEVTTVSAKYVFLDVVSFTRNRSVEAQSDIVSQLNAIVLSSIEKLRVRDQDLILLPTGDGICICLLDVGSPYDIHVLLALEILKGLQEWNSTKDDKTRQFRLRIGVSANVDNLVVDVNTRPNVAGAGINTAQRVMSSADANQIMVAQVVYETLQQREKYMNAFRKYISEVKHGVLLPVYQLIESGHTGLNTEVPSQFVPKARKELQLSKFAAYYLAHALKLESFLSQHAGDPLAADAAAILLWILAKDSLDATMRDALDTHRPRIWKFGQAGIEEQFKHYYELDWIIKDEFGKFVRRELSDFSECFRSVGFCWVHFVSETGEQKLKRHYPEICQEIGLDDRTLRGSKT